LLARPGWRLAPAFFAFHFLLYTGITAFNSYYDRDEGPVGGLEHPPPIHQALLPLSLLLQAAGLARAAFVGAWFAGIYLVFVALGGIPGAIALAGVGVCVIGTFGVTMVMSQEYLPNRIGMASGLSIGLSIGSGGIAAVGLGALADAVDLRTALYVERKRVKTKPSAAAKKRRLEQKRRRGETKRLRRPPRD